MFGSNATRPDAYVFVKVGYPVTVVTNKSGGVLHLLQNRI